MSYDVLYWVYCTHSNGYVNKVYARMNIKDRLKLALEQKNMSIKDFSLISGIAYRSLQNYLRGEREPNADALAALSTHLGISADWLLTGRGNMFHEDSKQEQQQEAPQPSFSKADLTLLKMLNDLEPEVRKDILRRAEEKQRILKLEKEVQELSNQLEKQKKVV